MMNDSTANHADLLASSLIARMAAVVRSCTLNHRGSDELLRLYLQLGTTVIFAAWRAFLYSTISAFNGEAEPADRTANRWWATALLFSFLLPV